jgi:hypothetical protein
VCIGERRRPLCLMAANLVTNENATQAPRSRAQDPVLFELASSSIGTSAISLIGLFRDRANSVGISSR